MINVRAAGDSRHARTGKDGAFYSKDGVLLATVEQFVSHVNFNNSKYSVIGDAQEHEYLFCQSYHDTGCGGG